MTAPESKLPGEIYFATSLRKNRAFHRLSGLASFVRYNRNVKVFMLEPGQDWRDITDQVKAKYNA